MTGTVRMDIKNNKIQAGAMEHKVLLVVARVCLNFAKDTACGGVGSGGGGNVLTSPWAPQPIQFKLPQRESDYRIGGWRVSSGAGIELSEEARVGATSTLISSFNSFPGLK